MWLSDPIRVTRATICHRSLIDRCRLDTKSVWPVSQELFEIHSADSSILRGANIYDLATRRTCPCDPGRQTITGAPDILQTATWAGRSAPMLALGCRDFAFGLAHRIIPLARTPSKARTPLRRGEADFATGGRAAPALVRSDRSDIEGPGPSRLAPDCTHGRKRTQPGDSGWAVPVW